MGLIQEVQLLLDKASARRLAADMGRAGKESGDKLEKEVGGGFDRIKSMAAKVGAAIVAAFAIQRIIAFGRSLVVAAMDSERAWSRLEASLSSVGVRLSSVRKEIDALALSLRDQADNEEVADVLGDLVQITSDYSRSLSAVSVVIDLARAKNMSLESATLLVGRAMIGHTETLQRYGVQVTKGSDALEQLRKQFAGFAAAEAKTLSGQVRTLGNAWGDAKETFGAFLTEAGGGISIIQALTQSLRWLNAELDMHATAKRFEKEMELGSVQERLAKLQGLPDMMPVLDKDKGEMGRMSTVGEKRTRLLAREKELLTEVTEASRQWYAEHIASQKRLADQANQRRLTEEEIAAALKAQLETEKEKIAAWEKALPVWAATRQGEVGADAAAVRGTPVGERAKLFTPAVPIFSASEVSGNLSDSIGANVTESLRMLAADPPGDLLTEWDSLWSSISSSSHSIAMAVTDAWAGSFRMMMEDGWTLANAFEGIGRSMGRSLMQGVSAFATSKVAEEIARGFSDLAESATEAGKALSEPLFAGFHIAAATMLKSSAKSHFLASAKWGLLGGAGAALGGLGATSAGGLGSGYRTGAGTRDSLESERRGTTINIRVDGLSPTSGAHQDLLVETMRSALERHGEGAVFVNGKRQG